MGHKDNNTFQEYIGKTSGVDVQAIIGGETPDQGFIDFVASMQTTVDLSVPVQHGSLLVHARKRDARPVQGSQPFEPMEDDRYDPFDGDDIAAPFTSLHIHK